MRRSRTSAKVVPGAQGSSSTITRPGGHMTIPATDRQARGLEALIPDIADAEANFKQVAQLRVRATWRVIDRQWGELTLEVKDPIVDKWLPLSADPVRVARRFSGKDDTREAPELTAVAFLRKVLGRDSKVRVLRLSGQEERVGAGVTDWRYWACLSAPLTVGLVHQYDGSVAVVGV
ncbi:hypothetical protein PBI_ETNA_63 [Microbacterium phage Etna]|uniref:Uncharacterized protein n=1 Tax=Microbacterium phage Etna TaxID=2126930 RepID=A0A2R4A035_9CAUD|nr:hypothetical protein PBI_ETNA_63 [Microbacterium phage Etna]